MTLYTPQTTFANGVHPLEILKTAEEHEQRAKNLASLAELETVNANPKTKKCIVLKFVKENPKCQAWDVEEFIKMSRTSTNRLLQELEAAGLVYSGPENYASGSRGFHEAKIYTAVVL